MDKVLPFWNEVIVPVTRENQKVIIYAHGNSLRSLIKYIDNLDDADITRLEIPTGIPLVYELDKKFNSIKHYYLTP